MIEPRDRLKPLNLVNKLLNANLVCNECGTRYGKYSVGCSSVHMGTCDVCGEARFVTEPRDYGYLQKGIDEVRATIKEQSKEVAEYMANQETEDKVTYKSTITGVCVHRVDANHRTLQTEVKLEDEGGGEFITLTDTDGQQIRLDFEEFDEVVKAVALLKGQGGTTGALEALDRLYRENGEGMKRLAAE